MEVSMRARWIALLVCLAGCPKPNPPPGPGGGPPAVPPELAVPAGNQLTLAANAKGVQIYECAPDASGTPAWKLHAPRAELLDAAGKQVGVHFGGVDKALPAGPYWQANDGSRVHGANPVSVANPGSIALLRLEAADTSGAGIFSKVTFIQRLDTTGGVSPAGACRAGDTQEVAYTAKYTFYAKS
jgi:hypothetical protein